MQVDAPDHMKEIKDAYDKLLSSVANLYELEKRASFSGFFLVAFTCICVVQSGRDTSLLGFSWPCTTRDRDEELSQRLERVNEAKGEFKAACSRLAAHAVRATPTNHHQN